MLQKIVTYISKRGTGSSSTDKKRRDLQNNVPLFAVLGFTLIIFGYLLLNGF